MICLSFVVALRTFPSVARRRAPSNGKLICVGYKRRDRGPRTATKELVIGTCSRLIFALLNQVIRNAPQAVRHSECGYA